MQGLEKPQNPPCLEGCFELSVADDDYPGIRGPLGGRRTERLRRRPSWKPLLESRSPRCQDAPRTAADLLWGENQTGHVISRHGEMKGSRVDLGVDTSTFTAHCKIPGDFEPARFFNLDTLKPLNILNLDLHQSPSEPSPVNLPGPPGVGEPHR